MQGARECPRRIVRFSENIQDSLNYALGFVPGHLAPGLNSSREDLGGVKLDTLRIVWLNAFCKTVKLLSDPVCLSLIDRYAAQNEILLLGIRGGTGVVEIEKMQGAKKGSRVNLRSSDCKGSPPNCMFNHRSEISGSQDTNSAEN